MRNDNTRRGSAYAIVLATSTLVTLIGLASLTLARVERRGQAGVEHAPQARMNALAGIDFALLIVNQDLNWRSTHSVPVTGRQMPSDGAYDLAASDPVDGNLTNNNTDAVLLTATGVHGEARVKLQVTLNGDGSLAPGTWRWVVD